MDTIDKKDEALAEQPAQQQEPVAWAIFTDAGNARMWSTFQPHLQKLADAEGLTITSLYTSPPASKPWVGLTDVSEMVEAELTHYWNGEYADTTGARDQLTDFARAIEDKLREKNS